MKNATKQNRLGRRGGMKKIDMSVFVGQEFDCEFWRAVTPDITHIGYLTMIHQSIAGNKLYHFNDEMSYHRARPRLNHWHFNDGSMVLPDGLVVKSKTRDGRNYRGHNTGGIGGIELKHIFGGGDIIAVKIIGAHPDYAEDAKRLCIPVVEV